MTIPVFVVCFSRIPQKCISQAIVLSDTFLFIGKNKKTSDKTKSRRGFFIFTKQNKQQSLIWHTEKRKVSEQRYAFAPHCSYNPRSISPEQKKQLIKSLQKFNLAEIPAVNTDNQILVFST